MAGPRVEVAASSRPCDVYLVKAWRVYGLGEPVDVMNLEEVLVPQPDAGQLLVRVLGAAANFADALVCRGLYQVKPPLPFTPGLELCGEVAALGPGTTGFAVGDRVIGSSVPPAGGFAELALMDAATTFAAPPSLNDAQAAAFNIAYQTGWLGLHHRAHLQAGETLLVHAAAGGVGSAAVQLGKAAGARVIGVVGGHEKAEVARTMGADVVVDRHTDDFVEVVKDVTGGRGADVVYDPVGGETYQRSTKCIAFEGRILVVGFAGGQIQSAALNHALVKNYSIVGLHWGLYLTKNPALMRVCHEELSKLAADGVARPLVSEWLALDAVAQGLQRLADGATVGRVVFVA
jgi:NADPH2:quinone reductase